MNRLPKARRDLAVSLLVPQERWGWEYVVPAPAMPSPLREQAPCWVGLPEPETLQRDRARARGRRIALAAAFLMAAWASVLAAALRLGYWPVVGGALVVPVLAWCVVSGMRSSAARRKYVSRLEQEQSRFGRAVAQWQSAVAEHDRREQLRVTSAALWYPLQPAEQWAQVNVFGGTADGWSSLLVTLGLSLQMAGSRLLVLDFSERGVASELVSLADTVGYETRVDRVPADGVVGMDGLSAVEAGELAAEVLTTVLGRTNDGMRQAVDAELVQTVVECLEAPYTFERVAAGLAMMRRTLDVDRQSCLSAAEVRGLNRATENIGPEWPSVGEELRFVSATMRLLGGVPQGHSLQEPLWPQSGLRVIATADTNARRKDLLDRFVFFRVLHEIRTSDHRTGDAVVVAGADQLGAAELEALARHADRVGMRLIVMCEHLRGEQLQFLGAAGSATVLMRLGHTGEAAAAADFVGRGHRFVLSQLTEQIGRSFTDGVSDTAGDSLTSTVTDNFSPTSSGSSDSQSRATTWSQTRSWSRADSASDSRGWTRAYEYVVEPTTFQALPATAFIWVETGGGGRRIVAGDCNPGIALLDRVAASPRTAATVVSC
ncbi:hypothetical protein [Nocardia macrotermitis]|uniref:Uncharacterized protein n=1 Tax=Nocardia macrotermitis TaxID=2585198 RepID=A0A7K0DAJ2_9NOCA|nr:hypothetical protein [Nocardia macrotermitis]MQY22737.1 hypothetical protein [Nocardia macrotermitis]